MAGQWIKPVIITVTGGREWKDASIVEEALSSRIEHWVTRCPNRRVFVVIGGAKTGVDEMARQFCMRAGVAHAVVPAEWDREDLGKAAGHMRNQQMLDWFSPDEVLVYPGGNGTFDMLDRARSLRITQVAAQSASPVSVLRIDGKGVITPDKPGQSQYSDVEDLI